MGISPTKPSPSQITNSEQLTEGIRSLTDGSVYELYVPEEGVAPQVEVIFFHGLPLEGDYTDAYWKTWLSRDGKVVWPKEWLPGSLSSPRILSISYDSYVRKHDGKQDSYTIAEKLIKDLILDGDSRAGQNSPVFLVGHCLGGIIIKEFLLACLTRRGILFNNDREKPNIELIDNFLENCKGVFYYSTPHHGSAFIDSLQEKGLQLNGDLVKLLNVLSSKTARINSEFAMGRVGEGIQTSSMGESFYTKYMGVTERIVEEGSSRSDTESYYTAPTNHFDVCKPNTNKACSIFKNLVGFIKEGMKDKGLGLRNKVEVVSMRVLKGNEADTSHTGRPDRPSEVYPRPIKIDQCIKKLNDSVYRLYSPQCVPKVVVIFFHGLPQENDHTDAYSKTWLARDSEEVWPKEWLPETLPSPQILSISYNSCVVPPENGGASDSYVIAENLIQDIILDDKCELNPDCPVILVGHSLGGIIIRELLFACWKMTGQLRNKESAQKKLQRIAKFRKNCMGVFYYSTPNHGSKFIADLTKEWESLNDLMKLLSVFNSETERINSDFANARRGEEIKTQAIRETRDTTYLGFKGKVVEEGSAISDIDDGNIYAVDADHFDVCKPTDRKSNIYTHLLQFILTAISHTQQTQQFQQPRQMMTIDQRMTLEQTDEDSDRWKLEEDLLLL